MPRLDGVEGFRRDAEAPGDGVEELLLALVVAAVGERHVEQALEDVLEHPRPVAEHGGDAGGIGLEAGHVLPRQVEDPRRRRLVLAGDVEDLAERRDLVGPDEAVRLRHLRPEAEDGDGEGDAPLGRAAAARRRRAGSRPWRRSRRWRRRCGSRSTWGARLAAAAAAHKPAALASFPATW